MHEAAEWQEPIKDEDSAHPVASAWRDSFCAIVKAFAEGDYRLEKCVAASVAPVATDVAQRMREYVADYGETLIELPTGAWDTSIAQWMGTHWDVLVDLWTAESGRSDMVISARVSEAEPGFRIEVCSIHVP
jgi:hypothetical protein